jgi:hypothetical protein
MVVFQSVTPFESIDNAQDYLRLLAEELARVIDEVEADSASVSGAAFSRRLDAVRLVSYKLRRLQQHIQASGRLLNDLRMLRRILGVDAQESKSSMGAARVVEDEDAIDEFGI